MRASTREYQLTPAELKPDSMKGYTIGDNTNKNLAKHPWHLDDEKLVYPAYAKFLKAGLRNVCVHKGLFPPDIEKQYPHLHEYCAVRDVGKAAKDWPQMNFIADRGAAAARDPEALQKKYGLAPLGRSGMACVSPSENYDARDGANHTK